MATKKLFLEVFWIFAVFLFGACRNRLSIGDCIPPPEIWEFPVGATITTSTMPEKEEILPSGDWQVVDTLAQEGYVRDIVANLSSIWIILDKSLFKYQTLTHIWEEYPYVGNMRFNPSRLYVAIDGTLWAGINKSDANNSPEFSPLVRYDDVANQFEFVSDQDGILNDGTGIEFISGPITNQNNSLWMLLTQESDSENVLYKLVNFDPEHNQLVQHFTIKEPRFLTISSESRFGDITFGPDGNI